MGPNPCVRDPDEARRHTVTLGGAIASVEDFEMRVRLAYLIPGVLLLLVGVIWVLQGAGVMGGSIMSGQKLWLGIGIVVAIVGLGLGYLGLGQRARRA